MTGKALAYMSEARFINAPIIEKDIMENQMLQHLQARKIPQKPEHATNPRKEKKIKLK